MARGRKRDLRRMVVAAVEDRAAAGRGVRRRRRRAQGAAHGLALDARAALPVPRVHEHHRTDRPQAASRGGQEPEEGRRRPVARLGRRFRGGMAGIVQPQWEQDHKEFLDQNSHWEDGTVADQHRSLAKARRMIRRRIREGHLFTFVEPPEGCMTPILPTNNLIESWNARIRDMLRRHRGLSLVPADQGGAPVVPPAHHASGTRRVARGQRRHGRTNRSALPGSLGTQPAGCMADDRDPDAIRNRHRLGRIPHPNRNTTAPPTDPAPDTQFGL